MSESKKKVVREIDYSVHNTGPLFIDPKHKKAGFQYCLVSNKPGELEQYQRWGYETVQDESIEVGQDHASKSSAHGSAVTIQSKCGQLLVLMAIEQDLYDALQKYRAAEVRKTEASIGKIEGVPDHLMTGKVTLDNNSF
jgi:hypothetical protein